MHTWTLPRDVSGESKALAPPSWASPRRRSLLPVRLPSRPCAVSIVEKPAASVAPNAAPSALPAPPRLPAASVVPERPTSAELAAENEALCAQIAEMAAAMASMRRDVLQASERDLVCLARAIAERVVERELEMDPELVTAWVKDAISSLASQEDVVVVVAPNLAERVSRESWAKKLGVAHRIEVNASLAPYRCEVRSHASSAAASMAARIDAVAAHLGIAGK